MTPAPAPIPVAPPAIVFHVERTARPDEAQIIFLPKILDAIAQVESGRNDHAHGPDGELTRYQIKPATWRRFSAIPMASAGPDEVWRVANLILAEIIRSRRLITPFYIALGWRCGPNWLVPTLQELDYANRVQALYNDAGRTISLPANPQ